MVFRDRRHAGQALARQLGRFRRRSDVVVVGLPRGGVPVAAEVAGALGAPLDVLVVRKIGFPGNEEVAVGAIASGGFVVENARIKALADDDAVAAIVAREQIELARRERLYRSGRPSVSVAGRVVIVVDDGLATGATMAVAVRALRAQRPRGVIVAVPVAAADAVAALGDIADDVVCVDTAEEFASVGACYVDFAQTSDAEVQALLTPSTPTSRSP